MIPILFDKTETAFTTNGIGRLADCISCKVTEERNGIYELEFTYPITGKWYSEMKENGGIIGVIHDDNHDIQPFDIYSSTAPLDGIVTFYAHHISYRLNNIILEPYTASTASAAVAGITTHSVNTNPFTFSTDKSVTANFSITHPVSVRSILFGSEGSLLDVYGTAEFKFDKFDVQMLLHRGSDTGVTVRYGKNMTAMTQEYDESSVFSAVAPYWASEEEVVYLPEYIVGPTTAVTPVVPVPLDMTEKFISKPSVADLRSAAVKYLDTNTPWIASENIKIDFTAMWQSPEYADLAQIQRVGLCDTVSVYHTGMGIVKEQTKVVRVVYNVLAERFDEMELGALSNYYVAIEDTNEAKTPVVSVVTDAINAALASDGIAFGGATPSIGALKIPSGWDFYVGSQNIFFQSGSSYTQTMPCFGYVTDSGKRATIYCVPARNLAPAGTITVTAVTSAQIRTVDGSYLVSNNATLTSYITSSGRYGGTIRAVLDNSSGFGVTNQTPIVGLVSVGFTVA